MLPILFLAAAAPATMTAIDAERAFDQAAAREGQWTAFREFAAPDAVMFVPKQVAAQAWLKNRKNPPVSVRWQPTASFVSCSGSYAVNTGAWQRPDGSVGYFTTVWNRDADGKWNWLVDRGDKLLTARVVPAEPRVQTASCQNPPRESGPRVQGMIAGGGPSDFTLMWYMKPQPHHVMRLGVMLWNGKSYDRVLVDDIVEG